MSARAGIVVTGTEVLSGRVADRNGPFLSDRLRELGVDHAFTLVVGDRPEDMERALAVPRIQRRRRDRHERRPRPDRGRPHRRGRRALPGPRDGPGRRARGSHRRDPRPLHAPLAGPRPRGDPGLEPQAGDRPGRRDDPRAGGDGARAGRAARTVLERRADGRRAARAAARAAGDVARGGGGRDAARRDRIGDPLRAAHPPAVRHPGVRDRRDAARRRGVRSGTRGPGDHDVPAARRARGRHALRAVGGG